MLCCKATENDHNEVISAKNLPVDETYCFSFNCHPDTKNIGSVYERILLERSEGFRGNW